MRCLLALFLCLATAAGAQPLRPLTFKTSYAVQTDSNFFRLPDSADIYQLTGQGSRSERIGVGSFNVNYTAQHSLQKFEVDAILSDYRYQNFDRFNFAAKNYNARWLWSATPRVTGNLSSERQQILNSFTDTGGYNQRNVRTTTSNQFDARYPAGSQWQLTAGLGQTRQTNEQTLLADNDYQANDTTLGVRYTSAADNTLAYTMRRSNGDYLRRALPNSGAYDTSYTQTNHELRLRMPLNGIYSVDANLSATSRSHPHYPGRNYSGVASGVSVNWLLSGKTSLTAAYSHQLSPYQTGNANYAQADRFSLGAQWAISSKMLLNLSTAQTQTDYLGYPDPVQTEQRRDTLSDTALSFTWQPYQRLNLSATVQNAARSSNSATLDYRTLLTTFAADYSF